MAFGSVVVLAGSGLGEALNHLPTLDALWRTGYGQAILVKTGLFAGALLIASGNLLRPPRLAAAGRQPNWARRPLSCSAAWSAASVPGHWRGVRRGGPVKPGPPPPAFALQDRRWPESGPGRWLGR